jgi:superoxide dismutase, Cu-Zn family
LSDFPKINLEKYSMKHVNVLRFMIASVVIVSLSVMARPAAATEGNSATVDGTTSAVCVVVRVGEHKVRGVLRFTQKGDTVRIRGMVRGLAPGEHGFHVHEFGDVSGRKDGKSTGGHYNPGETKHGKPSDKERHVGDLGNITADADGVAKVDITDDVISLNGPQSIIGRSILIHAGADDYGQPTGNAGARVGFGVIGIAKPAGS